MLYCEKDKCYTSKDVPRYVLNRKSIEADEAVQIIKNQLLDEGNARQNLATFCQTFMEKEANKLLSETLEKNAIDKSEYPQTAELENRCVNIIADLWNASPIEDYTGTSTTGSSEACMLAGLAMKFRWRDLAKKRGLDINKQKPNLIISSAYQVCWEKFCVYWDIELRKVPIDKEHLSLDISVLDDYVDDYTIGIVGILGITYTGRYDDILGLDSYVEKYNKCHEHQLAIHIDGASGGLFAPFVDPELKWDFALKNVISINTSGHKYGLVYPGVGWVLWRDKKYLPEELVFEVSYLGGTMPTIAINFSRNASMIIGQYYNFLRYGRSGYEKIHRLTRDVAKKLGKAIEKTGYFTMYNIGEDLPVICYAIKDEKIKWNLYDLSDRLMMRGWQVPAYPLPSDLQDIVIQRIVCRADFSENMADSFINDFQAAIKDLNKAHILFNEDKKDAYGFTH